MAKTCIKFPEVVAAQFEAESVYGLKLVQIITLA